MCWTKYIVQHICCRVHIVLDEHCSTQANLQAMSEGNKVCDLCFSLCVFSNVARPVTKRTRAEEVMHLAVVACGNRLDETLTMVKSALLFSIKRITFHIFAEDPLAPQFKERVRILRWPDAKKYTGQIFQIKRGTGATSPTV